MLKTEVVEFQEIMNDLLDPFANDDKKPSYYILNFKDKTIVPVSGISIRALKAFGKDRYSVFIKRYKYNVNPCEECETGKTIFNPEFLDALDKATEEI